MQPCHLDFEALVFDFDGTLATLNIDFSVMRTAVLAHISSYSVPSADMKNLFVLEMIEAGRLRVANRHPERSSRYLQEALHLIREIEIRAAKEGQLIEGTRDMLKELRRKNIKTAVVTRNCHAALEQVFPDIYSSVNIVLSRDHISRVKPDPEHLRHALFQLQATPEKSAMVGDHPMDIKLGIDVGTLAVGVLTGFSDRGKLTEAGADMILEKAADILPLLK